MKKLFALILSGALALSLAGCGAVTVDGNTPSNPSNASNGGSSAGGGTGSVGLAISTMNNPFFVTLSEGAEAKAKELGVTLIVADAGDDSAKQTNDIEDLVSRGIKVLIGHLRRPRGQRR